MQDDAGRELVGALAGGHPANGPTAGAGATGRCWRTARGVAFRAEFEIRLILWIVEVVWIVLAVLLWLVLSRFTGG